MSRLGFRGFTKRRRKYCAATRTSCFTRLNRRLHEKGGLASSHRYRAWNALREPFQIQKPFQLWNSNIILSEIHTRLRDSARVAFFQQLRLWYEHSTSQDNLIIQTSQPRQASNTPQSFQMFACADAATRAAQFTPLSELFQKLVGINLLRFRNSHLYLSSESAFHNNNRISHLDI